MKVLLGEDNQADAELVLRQLRKAGFAPEWTRVDNEAALRQALRERPDVVLCDYGMPQFTGLQALGVVQEVDPGIPFVLISGTIGEDTAVEAMRLGALDYLLKDRLARLGPAVEAALAQGRLRRESRHATESLQLFRTLVDQSSDAFEVIERATARFIDINECACRELGYSREELLRMGVFDIDPMVSPGLWTGFMERLQRDGCVTGETVHRRKDGTLFPVEFNSRLVRLDREYVVSVVRNISERKQAVEALQKSEERFREMAENIDEVFWMTNAAKDRMLYISPGYERIWGRTCAEVYARPRTWIDAILPEDRARVLAAATTKQATGEYAEEYRIVRPDGSVRWIHDRAFPIRDSHGKVCRIVGVASDVTGRKDLEAQFLRAQRLEAVGTLAGGIAHDLNNILAPMMMITGLLKGRLTAPEDVKTLGMLEGSVHRGANIVRQLLTFSRGLGGEKVAVQVRHLIKEMTALMKETFPREIAIRDQCAGDLWPVLGDPTMLHQVLMNLCVNSRDAMPGGGELRLVATNVELDGAAARVHPKARPGKYVVIDVVDTGHGIPPEILDRVFDPFFTTKGIGQGTGLGLSTVLGIVESHGGFVTLQSEPGHGTVFHIHLPAVDFGGGGVVPAADSPSLAGGGEMILVVDDEENIGTMTRLVLEQKNYRVLVARDGREALARLVENQDAVRLVITDMMMPVMGGAALIRALRTLRPGLRVIATSGLEQDAAVRKELEQLGVLDVIPKPSPAPLILKAVRTALGR
ncbi:MAG TPA: PAS domain S-box protein [Lacunisphaera sp.]|nr:PAS domain S-box protein [Lacunisphaera sp.]